MSRYGYSYCFLRYRQDPDAGEFANIGVAFWVPQLRFLAFEGCDRYSRLTQFFGDLDRDGYRRILSHVERQFTALAGQIARDLPLEFNTENVRDIAVRIVPEDDGSLIWSPSRGGFTENPSQEVSRIFDHYIGRHYQREDRPRRDDKQLFREVYQKAFTPPLVAHVLQEREIVAPLARYHFSRAWKNGTWNVYEPVSFDFLDSELIERKAHTWFGRSIHLAESPDQPKLHFLLGKPSLADGHQRSYEQAKEILTSAKRVSLIEEDGVEEFARQLEAEVAKST